VVSAVTSTSAPIAFPFNNSDRLELDKLYAAIREDAGLVRVRSPYGESAWLVTRYADAKLVLGDRRFSRAMAVGRDAPRMVPMRLTPGLLTMDPPEHTRLRTLLAKAFTQRRVERLRPRVRELAEELVSDLVAVGPPVDLVERFALPLPVAVICELLGVPVADRPLFRVWSDVTMSTSRRTAAEFEANRAELHGYIAGLIEQRRAHPADDLMTALVEAHDEQDRLTGEEMIGLCTILLVAGHETTATQIPNFVYVLLERPEVWARLRADPELIPAAVEELLRFVPLVEGASIPHYANEDVEVGGVLVRAGEPVLVAFAAANRDPSRFGAPDELRFDRAENQHVGFGHGVHHCLGAQLARVELQEALRVLTARLPGLRLAGDPDWKVEMFVRGPRRMPVGW
jgi:cytochrome P450